MLLLIPGPVQTRPEVKAAMAQDYAPWDMDFRPIYADIRARVLAIAGGREGEHATLPLQGCGHFMVEAVVRSFIPAGGKLLVVMNGSYAQRADRLAREAGRVVVPLPLPDTRSVTEAEVAAALAADPDISHVLMVQNETGSGIVNDVEAVGRAVRAAGRRLLLDTVSGFGALPLSLAEHPEIDALVFTSGKCLEGMPGIGFCIARIDGLKAGIAGSWSFDLESVYQHALAAGWGSFRFTPAVQALAAFRIALDLYDQEGGQPARHARYAENVRIFYDGMRELGLTPYVTPENQGPVIVTVRQPADPAFQLQSFVDQLKARGVLISNFYNTQLPTFRVGCIGALGAEAMRYAVTAVRESLQAMQVRDMSPRQDPVPGGLVNQGRR